MPLTSLDYPILSQFLCVVEKRTGMPAVPTPQEAHSAQQEQKDETPKKLPKGVVLGPDGKPYVAGNSYPQPPEIRC